MAKQKSVAQDLIDRVKEEVMPLSDLAYYLQISPQKLSDCYDGLIPLSDEHAVTMAGMTGLQPAEVLISLLIEKAESPAIKELLRNHVRPVPKITSRMVSVEIPPVEGVQPRKKKQ